MNIKLADYQANFVDFRRYINKEMEQGKDLCNSITYFAVGSHIPLIVLYYFAKEIFGDSLYLRNKIQSLVDFYHYEEIV